MCKIEINWVPTIVKTGMSKMRNLKSTDKGVMVLGLAKSGSHLILSILDALGPGLRIQAKNLDLKPDWLQNLKIFIDILWTRHKERLK